jgi:hypothetical protein
MWTEKDLEEALVYATRLLGGSQLHWRRHAPGATQETFFKGWSSCEWDTARYLFCWCSGVGFSTTRP